MSTRLEIPEWTGSSLMVASFTNYVRSIFGDFRRPESVPALCKTIFDSTKMLLHAAGRLTNASKAQILCMNQKM